MDAGLSSITRLKAAVLPSSLRTRLDWDDNLLDMGLGVVGMMEGHCNRRFAYTQNDTFSADANRTVLVVPRYPVSEWTGVHLQSEPSGSWDDIKPAVTRFESSAGIIFFSSPPSTSPTWTVRATFTGGFWWDTTEDRSGTIPAGAVRLPYALFSAWTTQVQAIAKATELFGAAAVNPKAEKPAAPPQAELLPIVRDMLAPFRRFAS